MSYDLSLSHTQQQIERDIIDNYMFFLMSYLELPFEFSEEDSKDFFFFFFKKKIICYHKISMVGSHSTRQLETKVKQIYKMSIHKNKK